MTIYLFNDGDPWPGQEKGGSCRAHLAVSISQFQFPPIRVKFFSLVFFIAAHFCGQGAESSDITVD
jgi:hypothetical protein